MKSLFALLLALVWLPLTVGAQSNVRKVDFKNFTHSVSCGDADTVSKVRVKNGKYEGVKNSLGDKVYLNVYKVLYGDLNGDKKDEAVVLYSCGSGTSYVYFRGLIYTTRNNKPVLLTNLEGGNKGDGGFYGVHIAKNRLVVQRLQVGPLGSPCCPETIETTRYRLKGRRLTRVGKSSERKIPT